MKKNYFSLFAAASMMMAVTSCSQEEDFAPVQSGEMTTFKVNLEGAASSRAAADGMTATKLYFEVYQGTKKVVDNYGAGKTNHYAEPVTLDGGKAEIKLPLLRGEKYDIMFWAQAADGSIYDPTDLQSIKVNYKNDADENQTLANIEKYDAFFYGQSDFQATANVTEIKLRRPFAQLNIGTTDADWKTAITMIDNSNKPVTTSEVTVTGLATEFDVLAGEATGSEDVTFRQNDLLFETFKAKVNDVENTYHYLAMNYLLVPGAATSTSGLEVKHNTDVTATFWRGDQLLFSIEKTNLANVPIQRNWRTNILGNLLSDPKSFTIEIDEAFENDENIEVEIFADGILKAEDGFYHITKKEGLYSLANLVNNHSTAPAGRAAKTFDYTFEKQTFVLDCDIDLQGAEWTPIGNTTSKYFKGTFDGNGKTVSNFKVTEEDSHVGLFGYLRGSVKNLTVKNVTLKAYHYAGGIVGQGYARIDNCHVENITITVAIDPQADNNNGDFGDKAGGIIGQNCEGTLHVKDCSAKNVTITGYRDLGGIVGMAHNNNIVTNNTIENITIVHNIENAYKTEIPTTLGAVIGREGTNVTKEGNSTVEATIIKLYDEDYKGYYVDAEGNYCATLGKGINNAIADGATSVMVLGAIQATEINAEGKTVTIKGEGDNASIDFTGATNKIDCKGALRFENLTIKMNGSNYGTTGLNNNGSKHEYVNCNFYGTATVWGECTYTDCTFTATTDGQYAAFAQAFGNVTYERCTFTASNRAAKICPIKRNHEPSTATLNVTYTDCTFNAEKEQNKAAVEIDNNGFIVNVTFSGETTFMGYMKVNDYFASEGSGTTNVKLNDLTYVADGLWKNPEGVYELSKAAGLSYFDGNDEATINLMNDIEGTVVMKSKLTINGGDDKNYKIDAVNLNGADNVTLKNITFDAATAVMGYDKYKNGTGRQYANIITGDLTNNSNKGAWNLIIDGCKFEGTFAKAGVSICFADRNRTTGASGNVTIKNCTFDTKGGYYDIYGYYTGNGMNDYGDFVIESNTFKSVRTQGKPVYLGQYRSNTPVIVKNNAFETVATIVDAVYLGAASNYTVSYNEADNTFAE